MAKRRMYVATGELAAALADAAESGLRITLFPSTRATANDAQYQGHIEVDKVGQRVVDVRAFATKRGTGEHCIDRNGRQFYRVVLGDGAERVTGTLHPVHDATHRRDFALSVAVDGVACAARLWVSEARGGRRYLSGRLRAA